MIREVSDVPYQPHLFPTHPDWVRFAEEDRCYWATKLGGRVYGVMVIGAQDVMGFPVDPYARVVRVRPGPGTNWCWDWARPVAEQRCPDYAAALAQGEAYRAAIVSLAMADVL